jgi:hypothetical protein
MRSGRADRPIFIVGCPRSGTTMLRVMLDRHPRIAMPPETRFLMRAYQQRHDFGDLDLAENRAKVASFILDRDDTWFDDLGLDAEAVRQEIIDGPPTIGSALGIVLRAYAQRFDKPRWGDKRPGYHRWIEVLLRMFPDAQFIHVVRDPRDCVASLKRMSWWKRGSVQAMIAWTQAIDNVAAARRSWPDRIVEVQYERIVATPERELRRLCAVLGEEYAPEMTVPRELAAPVVPERKHWHANAILAPTTAPIGRWRESLNPAELALCETALARRMARFGYEPSGGRRAKPLQLVGFGRARRAVQRDPVAALLTENDLETRSIEPSAASG